MKLFSVPNLITLGNLFCGCLAVVLAFEGNLVWSAYLVGIAAVLDFLDGFAARALKQYSPIGKDLDSLADMVTFGFLPGVIMFWLLKISLLVYAWPVDSVDTISVSALWSTSNPMNFHGWPEYLPYSGFLITLFSALRLAKFNNDTRQSDSFIGVPTPANTILIASFVLIAHQEFGVFSGIPAATHWDMEHSVADGSHRFISVSTLKMLPWFLIAITIITSFLLIAEIPLFSLKIKSFGWKGNELRYSFLAACLLLLLVFKFAGLPLAIVLYILLSVINNSVRKKKNTPAEPQA